MLRLSRVTPATVDVLRELIASADATWGLKVVTATGRPAGSVYPILARLEEGGWVRSRWEDGLDRGSRRRFYELTDEGRDSAIAVLEGRRVQEASSVSPAARPRPVAS